MPTITPKLLEACEPVIRNAFIKAFANPNLIIIVAPDVSVALGKNLHRKLKAARAGLLLAFNQEHEWHRAVASRRLHINQIYDSKFPLVRTVTLRYDGLLLRPSEIAAAWLEEIKNRNSCEG